MKKEKLLEYINKQYPLKIGQLAKFFQQENSQNYTELVKQLNSLEDEFLIARNNKNEYLPFDESDYRVGTIKINNNGLGFIDYPTESYLIRGKDLNSAMDEDEVLIKLIKDHEGEVIKVLERFTKKVVFEVIGKNGKRDFISINQHLNNLFKIINTKDFKLMIGHYVETEIIEYYPIIKVNIIKIIGHKDDPTDEISAILLSRQFPIEFPAEVLEEAKQISEKVDKSNLINRIDHTDLVTVTIDGDDAKDLDDAISLVKQEEGYILYVHIADVSYYVLEGSALDREAYYRSSSIYLTDRVVGMLPKELSNGICSLNPHKLRLCLTCRMEITNSGDINKYDVYPSYIKITERMSYENVNKILQGDQIVINEYHNLKDLFINMKHCSQVIRSKRERLGAIDFNLKEIKILVDKNGLVEDIVPRVRLEAEDLIEDFMISANEAVADLILKKKIPGLYRVHKKPQEKKLKEFVSFARGLGYKISFNNKEELRATMQNILKDCENTPYQSIISRKLLQSMSKAIYSESNKGHFALGLEKYLHFTSPIRRYSDLIVHRQLYKYIFNPNSERKLITQENIKLKEIANYLSIQERRITALEYDVEDMKKAEYMLKYQNQPVKGIITSITEYGFYVELENMIEGFVPISSLKGYYSYDSNKSRLINYRNNQNYQLALQVDCIVKYVNKDTRLIELEVLDQRKRVKKQWKK